VGFETVETGSFVSPALIPQMKDSGEVISKLEKTDSRSRIMVLAGNLIGGKKAAGYNQVDRILFPYSASPEFLKRNINQTREQARATIQELKTVCDAARKELVVYLTMAFGNPYGDPWNPEIVLEEVRYLRQLGLKIIPLSDILGEVEPGRIGEVFTLLVGEFADLDLGVHLHARPGQGLEKIQAAWEAGVRRFDCVTGGFGGCPMASDRLVSNLDTYELIKFCTLHKLPHKLDLNALEEARKLLDSKF
jgi:hydroxymethylglutaryl-CoA lyase